MLPTTPIAIWRPSTVTVMTRYTGDHVNAPVDKVLITRVRSTEEPCASKGARTVLKTSEGSDPVTEFNQALRFAVFWRKMMQGTYNEKGGRWVKRILSVRETCRLQGRPAFPVLVDAVTCSFNRQPPDLSWIYMLTA
jgi:hypothetical protein